MDLLRILAAVGIVWFHTEGAPYRGIAYTGLPVFLLLFFSLAVRQGQVHTPRVFARRRWDRLLKPWLFWSAVYGVCRLVKAVSAGDASSLGQMARLETLLAGTCIHLWYLPFAFAFGLLLHTINRWIAGLDNTRVVLTATGVGLVTLTACTVAMQARQLPPPLPQWEFALAAIPLGLAVGRSLATPSRPRQILLLSTVSMMMLGACAILTSLGLSSLAVPYGLAMALVCLAYSWRVRDNGFIAAVAPLAFGVYLVHPLVIYGLKHFLAVDGHYVVFIALTTCISGLFTLALMKTPLRRFV